MWTYKQSTGELFLDGRPYVGPDGPARGYSGDKAHKNNPAAEGIVNQGPIPRGRYVISRAFHSDDKGPVTMELSPAHGQDMHGRGGFLIHGDSAQHPGEASHGCIIFARPVREAIDASHCRDLEVIR